MESREELSKCREEVEAALASKPATVEQVMPTDKVRKAAAEPSVINPSSVINPDAARKRGRPIKSNDSAHQQARERARRYRARKVIAQTGKAAVANS